jgi:SAM-dependent methyltransferase
MATAAQHYERHLTGIYAWTVGGVDAALAAGRAEIEALGLPRARGEPVVDLGAGFGKHAVALARAGARVIAIDASSELTASLRSLAKGLPIRVVTDDLLSFARYLDEPVGALLAWATARSPRTFDAVDAICRDAWSALAPGGTLAMSFRDYSVARTGSDRFIPVRSDGDRLLTCFLEFESDVVHVHDIVHERTPEGWTTRVSDYPKLRLAPERVVASMERSGFAVRREPAASGMVRLVGAKRADRQASSLRARP